MEKLYMAILIFITILILIVIYMKIKDKINKKEIITDSLILISTSTGILGGFSLLLTKYFTTSNTFLIDNQYLVCISIASAIFAYLVYFRKYGKSGFFWFLSEIFMAFGLSLVVVALIYLNTGNNFIPQEIFVENFPIFFKKDAFTNNEEIENIKTIGTLIILLFGILSVILAFLLHGFKTERYKN